MLRILSSAGEQGGSHAPSGLCGQGEAKPCAYIQIPHGVVETNDIGPAEKLAILKAWEADEQALLRAEDEGMGGGGHAHLHKVQAALNHLRSATGATVQGPRW